MPNDSYSSGHALGRAVSARARKGEGPSLEQYYVDRFIARISSYETPSFVLKGGQALNMRMVHARHTRDIDFATLDIDLADAVALITELAKRDLGDYLTYELARKKPIAENVKGRSGYSLAFTPYTDRTRAHDNIQVDLVAEQTSSREFDVLSPKRMMVRGL